MNLSIQTRELGGRGEACEFGASPQAGKQGVMRLLFHIFKQIQIHKRLTGDRPLSWTCIYNPTSFAYTNEKLCPRVLPECASVGFQNPIDIQNNYAMGNLSQYAFSEKFVFGRLDIDTQTMFIRN